MQDAPFVGGYKVAANIKTGDITTAMFPVLNLISLSY